MESYAPAAVLINSKHECLYYLGPTDRYLRVPAGPSYARSARHGASQHPYQAQIGHTAGHSGKPRIVVDGGRTNQAASAFNIAVHPVLSEGEDLLLVCFIDEPSARAKARTVEPRRTTLRGSPNSSRNSRPRGQNCRARSAILRFPANNRRRSTKKPCP